MKQFWKLMLRNPGGLMSSGVGGVQMADVSVDTETGIVKMNKFVAVQDCGLIINPWLAESQIHGAAIMGICAALFEAVAAVVAHGWWRVAHLVLALAFAVIGILAYAHPENTFKILASIFAFFLLIRGTFEF